MAKGPKGAPKNIAGLRKTGPYQGPVGEDRKPKGPSKKVG